MRCLVLNEGWTLTCEFVFRWELRFDSEGLLRDGSAMRGLSFVLSILTACGVLFLCVYACFVVLCPFMGTEVSLTDYNHVNRHPGQKTSGSCLLFG